MTLPYENTLQPVLNGPPILADYPQYVEPLPADQRFLAPAVVNDPNGTLLVRAWRYWYNAHGIVEMENRLDPKATAALVVHPWGIDDDHGFRTPEPNGVRFFCTVPKNRIGQQHMREVVDSFLRQWRSHLALISYSLPLQEDPIRRLLYASVNTPPEALRPKEGERQLAEAVRQRSLLHGQPLTPGLTLDERAPATSYMDQTPSTNARDFYNGPDFATLPMPLSSAITYVPTDRIFYDDEGYEKARDFMRKLGVRHILLAGYCTDMCVKATTCGYDNLRKDFNVFLVGDATLATFPASTTPRYATQVALANAALTELVTQVSWIRTAKTNLRESKRRRTEVV